VTEKYDEIRFHMPFDDFKSAPVFRYVDDYLLYSKNMINFIAKRNHRIDILYNK
jgi:hypothetical protein